MRSSTANSSSPILDFSLVAISSILLLIWPISNTIALRNGLLIAGTILALIVFKRFSCTKNLLRFLPISLGIGMFMWVLLHFLLFSQDPILQLHELGSTWKRSFLAFLIGGATGLVLGQRPQQTNFLWLGIYASFLILLVDYLIAFTQTGQVFMPRYYFVSPFGNKINTVIMGILFISGVCGAAAFQYRQINISKMKINWGLSAFWLSGVLLILFSYTTIIDTRNGIGIATILLSVWIMIILLAKLRSVKNRLGTNFNASYWKSLLVIALPLLILLFFIQGHLQINRGWNHFFEDLHIATQIDRYPQWQDTPKLGYPKTASGEIVYPNNYERAAWATAGIDSITKNPLGYGLLEHSLERVIKKSYPNATIKSAHSAWIDYGLAFGIPGLVLTLGALISIIGISLRQLHTSTSPAALIAIWVSAGLLLTFTFAEVSSKHSIEILFFCIALLSAMIFPSTDST